MPARRDVQLVGRRPHRADTGWLPRPTGHHGTVKGGLRIDEPSGERWDLALNLIESGEDFVMLGDGLQVRRHVGWPDADGRIHVGVLDDGDHPSERSEAQRRVDQAREQVTQLALADERLRSVLDRHGVVWEYAADDGSATWLIAAISESGSLIWPDL